MIKLNNYAQRVERRGDADWYRWEVFVDAPRAELDQIERVEYDLHPTFPRPHQVRTNSDDRFAVETEGWGEFTILATVHFRDKREERIRYALNLHAGWPAYEGTGTGSVLRDG